MHRHFKSGYFLTLLISSTISTQQVFRADTMSATHRLDPTAVTLDTTWQVLGPFPGGMRELPFGGFPPSVAASYKELLDPTSGAERYFSAYGPSNATTTAQTFESQVQIDEANHIKQSLTVEYPSVDWPWVRKSAGWSSLQWQMVAATDLEIANNFTALAITMDKTAEFAVVPKSPPSDKATTQDRQGSNDAIEWHTGDWYSYIASFSREDTTAPELSISQHLIHLDQGSYKLLVRSQYEIRIFGDPRNDGGKESPKMTIGIDVTARSLQDVPQQDLIEIHTDPHHSNVPHVVGGWVAGWGLSLALRNIDPLETYVADSVDVVASTSLRAELRAKWRIAPGQTIVLPIKLNQTSPLDPTLNNIELTVHLRPVSDSAKAPITKSVRVPLIRKPAFWDASSSDQDHNAYMYSYLADDGTVQLAAATPPKRAKRISAAKARLPPLILTLHGAGVDVRDLFFSNSIRRQDENWVILPTGRTPWGYDWQLASLQAADAAVAAFHEHLYGLPSTMSEEEKQTWQFDPEKLFVMGHSNGGQGAWYRLSRFPDRTIGGMVGSAYTKVTDYVSFGWKVGRHFTDPALLGILHSGVTMFENDLYASNLAGLNLLVKFGSADANVPPWNSKDMAMVVDGWNRRSGLVDKVKIAEVPGRPHWWDSFFSEEDVQDAIDSACSSSRNAGYKMPEVPVNFTLTVFNPAEAGSKGGWRISQVDVPGRLAKLEVRYVAQKEQDEVDAGAAGHFDVVARNARHFEVDLNVLRRSPSGGASLSNATSLRFLLAGEMKQVSVSDTERVHFDRSETGEWQVSTGETFAASSGSARPIGPVLRIVTSKGPMLLIVPSDGPQEEVAAWTRVARRFAADLLLYGAINSQILTDADFDAIQQDDLWKHSNIVTLGGPGINTFTRSVFDSWPTQSSIRFPSPDTSAQFDIHGNSFYENGTALLTLAPHPTYDQGLALVVHGIGMEGVSRAARLLPTRTATMIPEWAVVDSTAEWMGEGGVQAAGWYDREWGWSESMSYVQ
ncbi:hypothetical protein EX895_003957 [Sporisorium graminicola]|uniref:Peptidase S9 prolyl oligopeptidase catalytic domain-containing protein n=1 Tax=Sporisorium graminicola TaxID=280036 RepID=A0A4U7KS62_9BASI|nr:hypothetical protein EX895_003957 [Sporisorium graminicola]TKY87280.1 hypothetical protein EX895_003957 [Sporisorium graminicola]